MVHPMPGPQNRFFAVFFRATVHFVNVHRRRRAPLYSLNKDCQLKERKLLLAQGSGCLHLDLPELEVIGWITAGGR